MKNILLHTADRAKKKQILGLCKEMGLSVRLLREADLTMAIGTLAEFPAAWGKTSNGSRKPEGLALGLPWESMPDVMVFAGMDEKKLDGFLESYRAAQIAPIGLKAVVTPYNISWSLEGLISALTKEQEWMAK